MTLADFFHQYWWLIFPVFGMGMGFYGMVASDRRTRHTLDLIRTYVEQGKEPPPELLKLASDQESTFADMGFSSPDRSPRSSRVWNLFTFAALAAGFGVGYWWVRGEDYAFAFLIVAVTMAVLALGGLVVLLLGRKS